MSGHWNQRETKQEREEAFRWRSYLNDIGEATRNGITMLMKEQTRLILPTLVVSLLLMCLGGLSAWYLHQSQRESYRLLTHNITRVQAAEEVMLIGAQKQVALDQFLLTGERQFLEPMVRLRKDARLWIDRADELAIDDRDRALVSSLSAGHEHLAEAIDNLIAEPPTESGRPAAVAEVNSILRRQILEPAREYEKYHRERLRQSTERNQTLSNRMGLFLILFGISGALAGVLAGFAVARAAQRRLLETQRAMARSEQLAALGRIAAALAHELRNPLTSLRIIAQSATTNNSHVSLDREEFEILEQEIERLDDSINTFLDYARPPRPEKRSCILQSLLRQTYLLVERRAAQTGVEFHTELPPEPIEFDADPAQIKQVLLNILINALEASPTGGVVTVRGKVVSAANVAEANRHVSRGDNLLEIEIADSGSGLPEGLGKQIFDAFISTKETGTGLGLAICKRIIEEHGGEIDAHNAPEGGAVFALYLPIAQRSPGAVTPAKGALAGH